MKKYTNEKGEIDSETLKKEHPELCELICYRIPTEGYCSMFRIKVRKFTNPKSGGNITLPKAITTITGADFDIDKMFFLAPTIDSEGNFIKSLMYSFNSDIVSKFLLFIFIKNIYFSFY